MFRWLTSMFRGFKWKIHGLDKKLHDLMKNSMIKMKHGLIEKIHGLNKNSMVYCLLDGKLHGFNEKL